MSNLWRRTDCQMPRERGSSSVVVKAPVTIPTGPITAGVSQDSRSIKPPVCNAWESGERAVPGPELKHRLRPGKL